MKILYMISILVAIILFLGTWANNEQVQLEKDKEIQRLTEIIEMREKQLDLMVILAGGEPQGNKQVKTIEDTGIRDEVDILIKRAFTQTSVFVWEVK